MRSLARLSDSDFVLSQLGFAVAATGRLERSERPVAHHLTRWAMGMLLNACLRSARAERAALSGWCRASANRWSSSSFCWFELRVGNAWSRLSLTSCTWLS